MSRTYRFSEEYIGPVGGDLVQPIEKCDIIIGYDADNYGILVNWMETIRSKWGEK